MRSSRLRREIQFLRCYALGVTVIGGALFLVGVVHTARPAEFDRIVAQRIDVVDRKGKLAMILNMPMISIGTVPGSVSGKPLAKSEAIAALKLTTKPSLVGAWPGAGLSVENS